MNETMLLTVDDAARQMAISRSAMYALVMKGEIASVTIGRSRRIPADALAAFIENLPRRSNEPDEVRPIA